MTFQIHALPAEPFAALFTLTDAELAQRNAVRQTVTEHPGIPCRISLADAELGETVLLLNHTHLPEDSPYRASHAIYVREGQRQTRPKVGDVPDVLRRRLISLRLFDDHHMMIDADVVAGTDLAEALSVALDDPAVAYAHLHFAKPGCFAARVTRA